MLSSSNNNNLPDSLYNNQETNDKNSPKEKIDTLLKQVDDPSLYNLMKSEFKRLLVDQQRLITMLQQRSKLMENDNKQLRTTLSDNQKRYEKAVREMQFFKNKYDTLIESVKPYYPTLSDSMRAQEIESDNESTIQQENYLSHSPWTSPDDAQSVASRGRKNSTTGASIFSAYSSSTEATSIYSHRPYEDKKASRHCSRNPSIAYSVGAPSVVSGSHSSVRSSTLSVLPSIIQQRKTDPLMFGGSDPLWDTISKSRGRDVTVEKIIRYRNFFSRRKVVLYKEKCCNYFVKKKKKKKKTLRHFLFINSFRSLII
jgi:hypothetical protein